MPEPQLREKKKNGKYYIGGYFDDEYNSKLNEIQDKLQITNESEILRQLINKTHSFLFPAEETK